MLRFKIKPVKPINEQFTLCKCFVMAIGKNVNKTIISKESVDDALPIRLLEETDIECPNIHFHIEELSGLKLSMSEMYAIDEIIIEEG